MRVVARLLLVPFGLLLAISAGTFFLLAAAVVDPWFGVFLGETLRFGLWSLFDAAAGADDPGPVLADTVAALGRIFLTLLVAPPVFVALLGEAIGSRRLALYAGGTALLTGAMPWLARGGVGAAHQGEIHVALVLALAGAAAGAVYWLVAGSSAGSALSAPMPRGS